MNKLVTGAVAGLIATAPMTAVMVLMHRDLPAHERYPLPPRRVTMEIAEGAGIKGRLDEPERQGLTLFSHFAYGATIGAVYAPLARKIPLPPALSGAGFGVAVWAGSYLGWIPAAGIMSPATEHPGRRNALMIAAHVVWGAVAGLLVDKLDQK